MISLIVAMDEQRGIGINNKLPWHLPDDLAFFKKTTLNKPIIMGKNTFLSIGRALPNRQNIVLSKSLTQPIDDVRVARTLDEALSIASNADEIMMIGGARLYSEVLPIVNRMYITTVHTTVAADVFFPEINWHDFKKTMCEHHIKDERHAFDFDISVWDRI